MLVEYHPTGLHLVMFPQSTQFENLASLHPAIVCHFDKLLHLQLQNDNYCRFYPQQIVWDICTEPGILVVCRWPRNRYFQISRICCKYLGFDIRSNRDIADIWSNFVGKPVWYSEPQTGSGQLSYYIPSLGRQGRCCWCSKWSEIEINFLLLLFKKLFSSTFFFYLGVGVGVGPCCWWMVRN